MNVNGNEWCDSGRSKSAAELARECFRNDVDPVDLATDL